jgi:hypothetical protein
VRTGVKDVVTRFVLYAYYRNPYKDYGELRNRGNWLRGKNRPQVLISGITIEEI